MEEDVLSDSILEYGAFAQIYRWFQVYDQEQNPTLLENTLKALSDNFVIYTFDGTIKGKEGYLVRLHIQRNWRHAIHIKNKKFAQKPNGDITVDIEAKYHNILPDGCFNSYLTSYQVTLSPGRGELPLVKEFRVVIDKIIDGDNFESVYCENRCLSFLYYLLFCLGTYKGKADRFAELFRSDFTVQLNENSTINKKEEIEEWISESLHRYKGQTPILKNIKIVEVGKDKSNITFDLDWVAEWKIKHQSSCSCLIHYSYNEPFAKLEAMKIVNHS